MHFQTYLLCLTCRRKATKIATNSTATRSVDGSYDCDEVITIPALMALCEWNLLATSGFPSQSLNIFAHKNKYNTNSDCF